MNRFDLIWMDRVPEISQTPSGKLATTMIHQKSSEELPALPICQKPSGKLLSISATPAQRPADMLKNPLVLEFLGLGQMQMYVNYYDRAVKTPDENPTIGILLCKRKKDALIELTLPKNANIHASPYQLYLPSKEELRRRLLQWTAEEEAR